MVDRAPRPAARQPCSRFSRRRLAVGVRMRSILRKIPALWEHLVRLARAPFSRWRPAAGVPMRSILRKIPMLQEPLAGSARSPLNQRP